MSMIVTCTGCGGNVKMGERPLRGPSRLGNQAWICSLCDVIVCINCYVGHIGKEHPEQYRESPLKVRTKGRPGRVSGPRDSKRGKKKQKK